MMVEAGANELSEKEMLDAILTAHEEVKKIVAFIEGIAAECGKPKMEVNIYHPDEAFTELVREYARDKVEWQLDTFERKVREERSEQVKQEVIEHFAEEYPDSAGDIDMILYNLTKEIVRDKIINRKIRPDGRAQDEIRPIWSGGRHTAPRTRQWRIYPGSDSGNDHSHPCAPFRGTGAGRH